MLNKILASFGASLVLTGTLVLAGGQAAPVVVERAAQEAAVQALSELGGQTGQRLAGMPTADQMARAAPGQPFAVKMVRLDELQRYQPRVSDPATLLHDLQTLIYPIWVDGKVHGEMVVANVGGAWSARGFAGPAGVQAMENSRRQIMSAAGVPAESTMLVRVPALNLQFVAHSDAAGLHLTPVTDLATAGLKAGQTLPASRVFELLLPLALKHNRLPN
jgi:hypothetical protein